MQLQTLIADEDGVSPVIGVILMVAITVILAAVIGTFVLGLGDQVQNTAPQASFTFDYDSGSNTAGECSGNNAQDGLLTMTHDGGDKVGADDLFTRGSSESGANVAWSDCTYNADSDITAGDSLDIRVASTDTIRVVWNAGEDNSATLGKWTGPDA